MKAPLTTFLTSMETILSFGSHSYFKDFPEVIEVPKVVAKVLIDSTTAVRKSLFI